MTKPQILVIDNYDSFVYIIVQYLGELGVEVLVKRNDEVTVAEVIELEPDGVLISPGPGEPSSAGVSKDLISGLAGRVPILGVCLGHQAIGEVFGGRVQRAQELVHGKTSIIDHTNSGVFSGLPNPLEATRYHSLVVDKSGLPDQLEITATTRDGIIMGLRHKEFWVEGVQFHPESVLSVGGLDLFKNFVAACTSSMG